MKKTHYSNNEEIVYCTKCGRAMIEKEVHAEGQEKFRLFESNIVFSGFDSETGKKLYVKKARCPLFFIAPWHDDFLISDEPYSK